MGYGLAPSQQSADTGTGATPSLGESFLVQFFTCNFILYFKGGKKSVGSETPRGQVAHFAWGYQCNR